MTASPAIGTAPRPFRFAVGPAGLHGHHPQDTAAGWTALVRHLEDLGYGAIHVGDHLDDRLGPIAALMAAASVTESLRLTTMMLCNDYRSPVVVAKEFATIDALSGGRVELGIGAGWLKSDYESAGFAMESAGVRIARLEESVTVLKQLFAREVVSHDGPAYQLRDYVSAPRPRHIGGPPIILGGGGPKMLAVAGRHADIVALNVSLHQGTLTARPGASATRAATIERLEWVRASAGDRWPHIELQVYLRVVRLTDDPVGAAEDIAEKIGLPASDVLDSPYILLGSKAQMVDTLRQRREELGLSYISFSAAHVEEMASVVAELAGT